MPRKEKIIEPIENLNFAAFLVKVANTPVVAPKKAKKQESNKKDLTVKEGNL